MKVLLDHCVPRPLRRHLPGHSVKTAFEMGWALVKNGDLIRTAEVHFDVLITSDKNLRYQQNLKHRKLAIIELPTNYLPAVLELAPRIRSALDRIRPGAYIELKAHR
ncbi:hypothetical protein LBMAG56_53440 [Verrucomicrobiota bacterium]|nr:hypothetical protein LBMAG56_53440 [Verrucomicrobiota bacterium]